MEDLDRIKFEIEIGKVIDKVANENLKDFSNNYRIFDTLGHIPINRIPYWLSI